MAKKNPPPQTQETQASQMFSSNDLKSLLAQYSKPKKEKHKVPTSRNHCCVTYLLDVDEIVSILTRECVHHWAISPIHDKDVWTEEDEKKDPNHKCGTLKTPHRHLLVVFKDAKTVSACEKWFDRFSQEISKAKGLDKFEHTKSEICNDMCVQYRYQLHLDDHDKYKYDASERIVDEQLYWLNVDSTDGQSADNLGRQMVDDIMSGVSTYQMVCTYGKEYIYHKKHLDSVVEQVKIDEGLIIPQIDLDDWLIDAYLKSANFDDKSISLFHKMLEVVKVRYSCDCGRKIDDVVTTYLKVNKEGNYPNEK